MSKEKVLKVVANFTRKIASTANSSVSMYYVYQPKVPNELKNVIKNSENINNRL